jgi:hypothetical protein
MQQEKIFFLILATTSVSLGLREVCYKHAYYAGVKSLHSNDTLMSLFERHWIGPVNVTGRKYSIFFTMNDNKYFYLCQSFLVDWSENQPDRISIRRIPRISAT